ncbi:MAG: hypothetical protein CMH46_05545 [Muricauda sp.]|nr:hypothetical protein [Allomuricauda sp.]
MKNLLSFVMLLFLGSFVSLAQLPISEIQALKAFYDATGGPGWFSESDGDPTNDWNFVVPIENTIVTNDWYGLTISGNNVTQINMNLTGDIAGKNNLIGVLPEEIGDLPFLQLLNVELGELSGSIPASITTLTNLISLDLRGNNFTGGIPDNIGDLSNLTMLDLSQNQLTGEIPPSLLLLNNLTILSLRFNELTGEIPIGITNLINLRILYLGTNNFTGFIYPEYGNLINLTHFELENNELTGDIPEELGNLVNMVDFRIGSQELTGTLPASLGNFENIHTFNINNTLIEGSIPLSYENWSDPKLILLDRNNLTGQVPPQFANFNNLEWLILHDNELEGAIPDFSGISTLWGLDIANNRFEFGDFEDQFDSYSSNILNFVDNPQAKVDEVENITTCAGNTVILETTVSGSANTYEWFKDGVAIPGSDSANLELDNLQPSDSGVYTCVITSTIVTDLVLERNPITLTVSDVGPTANPIEDFYACDTDGDGIATFTLDLPQMESQVIGSQTGVTVSYFDAMGNPINLTASYTNTTPVQQDITVRVTSSSGCYNETVFTLFAQETPVADTFGDVERCDNFELPSLSENNYYYTGPNKTGTQLDPGDVISETTTVYVYAENGSGPDTCTDESSFTVTIDRVNEVTMLEDVTECKGYILPILPTGEGYFTESNGEGLQLYPGDEIVETQLIYVRAESDGCAQETSFTVTIDTAACNDSESLGLPKFFTPNNDGTNDYWDTSILAGENSTYIYVFDRYGKLLVQLDPNNNATWDGTYKGQPMPSSDYWFKYVDQGTGKTLSGHFTLKR